MKKKITISLDELILSKIDLQVENGDGKNRSAIIENILKEKYGEFVDMTAVLFCHDYKWDNRPYPFNIPKVFLEVDSKSLIARQLEAFSKPGIKQFCITVTPEDIKYFQEQLKDYEKFLDIQYITMDKEEKTGSALRKVLKNITGSQNLLISNGDIYYGNLDVKEYYEYHKKQNSDFSLCLKFVLNPEQLGNVKINGNKILEFIDRPKASQMNLTNSGLYLTSTDFLHKYDFGEYLEKDFFPKLPNICNNIGYIYSGQWEHVQNDSAYERINAWLM